ncbi:hypothetical protein CABS01_10518 [Colletotrichum abscissum]|uniref:Uncharacterized protein n=1 Tax=Colletotrichum abscissum TaxID=1671311 RepID=A0A9P9XDW8_9PEZI|nr:uncharacterized protein CABS01_10518 [Colletotrichum abscissum]KAI3550071.1 hypothetical protein CABS02_07759 [Colletotrichum abscissum]KAK1498743.1 hypothetical protein CABS01_10518 [Colletotrichum abscissum]
MSDSGMPEASGEDERKRQIHLWKEFGRYKPREVLALCLRSSGIHYGLPEYGSERPESNEWLLPDFDPTVEQPGHEVQVEVIRCLNGDIEGSALILLCRITKTSSISRDTRHSLILGLKVVLKIFDPTFLLLDQLSYFFGLTPSEVSNQLYSREANACKYFYEQKITGDPHMVPQYYGSWALKFDASDSPEPGRSSSPRTLQWRCASLPYIDHASSTSKVLSLNDSASRLKILKKVIHGGVCFEHIGPVIKGLDPDDIVLTFLQNTRDRQTPESIRPVLLDYIFCVVWSQSRESTHGRLDELDEEAPPIPRRYVMNNQMQEFRGWFPTEWTEKVPGDYEGKYDLIIEDSDIHPTPKEKRLAKAEADHKFMVEPSRKEREFLRRIGHPISAELEAECKDQPPSAELEAACEGQPLPETGSEDELTPGPDDHPKWKSPQEI